MDDLIFRQAAIDALGEPFVMSQCLTMEECDHMNFARALCIARIESIEPAQRWIPVTERMPEDGEWVLVWGYGQKIPIMMFHQSGAWIDDQFEFHTTITHWRELPEPPKEEP